MLRFAIARILRQRLYDQRRIGSDGAMTRGSEAKVPTCISTARMKLSIVQRPPVVEIRSSSDEPRTTRAIASYEQLQKSYGV